MPLTSSLQSTDLPKKLATSSANFLDPCHPNRAQCSDQNENAQQNEEVLADSWRGVIPTNIDDLLCTCTYQLGNNISLIWILDGTEPLNSIRHRRHWREREETTAHGQHGWNITGGDENAISWLGSHIDAQNTKEEPTKPDKIKIDAIDKKFTQSETVGLII